MANERRGSGDAITFATRQALQDDLVAARLSWAGRIEAIALLERLYDIAVSPLAVARRVESDTRPLARAVANDEGVAELVLTYSPSALLDLPDEGFLLFVCESLHPAVRPATEVDRLIALFNHRLAADGWEVVVDTAVERERPLFIARRLDPGKLVAPPGFPMSPEELLGGIVELLKLQGAVISISIIMAPRCRRWFMGGWRSRVTHPTCSSSVVGL